MLEMVQWHAESYILVKLAGLQQRHVLSQKSCFCAVVLVVLMCMENEIPSCNWHVVFGRRECSY